ncbi:MAG: RNA-binding S4 domain-containing protein [Nakamurella sp.]
MHDIPITGDMIRLGQLLKLAGAVDNGADVRPILEDGLVTVNDEIEHRRGRQLHPGDVVTLDGIAVRVAGAVSSTE